MKYELNIKEVFDLRKKLDKFCVAPTNTWKLRVMLEAINDRNFYKYILNILKRLKNITSGELDKLFVELRYKCDEYTIKYFESHKYEDAFKVETYFGIIEEIDELSDFAYITSLELKNKYGNEYVSFLDRSNPSTLTSFNNDSFINVEDDLIKKYLVLKDWQDKQNIFSKEVLHGTIAIQDIEKEILDEYKTKGIARVIYELNKHNYMHIDTCSILELCTIKKELINYIGGKAYGLSVLNTISKVPNAYFLPVNKKYSNELSNLLDKNKYYSVRSSADQEDGSNNSFAGMFSSKLNVKYEDIEKEIKYVRDSVNSDRVKSYVKIKNIDKPNMAVVIQEFVEPQISGVWIGKSKTNGILEYVNGNGEKLVSGNTTPIEIKDKNNNIYKYMLSLQKKLKSPCDFEWCSIDDAINMVQYRPVTTKIKNKIIKNDGLGVSSGVVSANIQFIDSPKETETFKEGSILLTFLTDPDWLPIITKSKGVITAVGGYLCHTAIICRELGIPCITDVGFETLFKLKDEKSVQMNGDTGKIIINKIYII